MAKQEKSAAELYREERKARIAKSAKKNAKKSISADSSAKIAKVISVVLVLALVGGLVGMAVNLSGVVERSRTALYVGDVEVSQPEYSYYYNTAYRQCAQYAQYAAYGYTMYDIGYDTSSAPDTQEYSRAFGDIEGFPEDQTPMWTDYFDYSARQSLQYIKSCVKEAEKLGITLGDEEIATVESTIEEMEASAKEENYSLSSYLRASIDKGMSVGIFRKILEENQLAQLVQEKKTEELEEGYTAKQVASEYKTNMINYATVTFRSYVINAETVEDEEAGTSAATDETMAAAKKVADKLAADSKDEASFKAAVSEIEKENKNKDYKNFLTDDSLTLQSDVNYETVSQSVSDDGLTDWLFSEKTAKNSTYVLETAETGYTVYLMVDPAHKAPDTDIYDVRHILIQFPEEEEEATETEETTEEETEASEETTAEGETAAETTEAAETTTEKTTEKETTAAPEIKVETLDVSKYSDVTIDLAVNGDTATDKETYKKAQDILKEYLDGDRTAASFAKLAQEYTDDSNGSDGGLYTDVPKGQMVSEFEDWCLKDGRKEGDVGIVETTYGYHIMYFVKRDVKTWEKDVRSALASTDVNEYAEELAAGDNVKISQENDKALAASQEFLVKLIKNNIKNSEQSLVG
ncbi:MAG: peptidylprolyl isomerase [Acutalibacteraceae bacterium]